MKSRYTKIKVNVLSTLPFRANAIKKSAFTTFIFFFFEDKILASRSENKLLIVYPAREFKPSNRNGCKENRFNVMISSSVVTDLSRNSQRFNKSLKIHL